MSRFGNLLGGSPAPAPSAPAEPTPAVAPSVEAEVVIQPETNVVEDDEQEVVTERKPRKRKISW